MRARETEIEKFTLATRYLMRSRRAKYGERMREKERDECKQQQQHLGGSVSRAWRCWMYCCWCSRVCDTRWTSGHLPGDEPQQVFVIPLQRRWLLGGRPALLESKVADEPTPSAAASPRSTLRSALSVVLDTIGPAATPFSPRSVLLYRCSRGWGDERLLGSLDPPPPWWSSLPRRSPFRWSLPPCSLEPWVSSPLDMSSRVSKVLGEYVPVRW